MKKVLMLTTVHPKDDHRIYWKETLSLEKNGYEVEILAPNTTSMIKHPITVCKIFLKGIFKKCDVIHCHEPGSLLLACLYKPFKRCKLIYDIHEFYPELMALRLTNNKIVKSMIIKTVGTFESIAVLLFADAIIPVNKDIWERFNKLCPKYAILENYPARSQFKSTGNKNKLVYIGTLTEERGILQMVEAFKKTANGELILVGKFWNKSYESAVKYAARFDSRIWFMGHVPYSQIPTLIADARAGLCVLNDSERHKNCIPAKFTEYMLSSKPIIATDIWKEYIEKSQSGIVVPYDEIDSLAEAMQFMINNPNKAEELGINGYNFIIENGYSWESKEKELLELYEMVV